MLKISVNDEIESTSFTVEGRMTARVVDELKGIWQAAIEREPLKPIVVKLAAVSFIDSQCKALLAQMHKAGVKILPTGCLMISIVREIEAENAVESRSFRSFAD
jgi:anti-anti-sigma regulatory factor